jgi:hypothetical protein
MYPQHKKKKSNIFQLPLKITIYVSILSCDFAYDSSGNLGACGSNAAEWL